jgi:hypothetical protein
MCQAHSSGDPAANINDISQTSSFTTNRSPEMVADIPNTPDIQSCDYAATTNSDFGWVYPGPKPLSYEDMTSSMNLVVHLVVAILISQAVVASVRYGVRMVGRILLMVVTATLVLCALVTVTVAIACVSGGGNDPPCELPIAQEKMWLWIGRTNLNLRSVLRPLNLLTQLFGGGKEAREGYN